MHDSVHLGTPFAALSLNDLVWMVKLMIRLTWMTQLTDTALLAGKRHNCKFGHYRTLLVLSSDRAASAVLRECPGDMWSKCIPA